MTDGPDLLVGVDVGMSCTGVAYLNRTRGNSSVKIFNKWPGRKIEDKAPTCIMYRDGNSRPSSWGFACDTDHEGELHEWFKTNFGRRDIPSQEQAFAHRLYKDFLECLYTEIQRHFTPAVLGKEWDHATVHFSFSVPTTWTPDIVAEFLELARAAGFGGRDGFKVEASLTEPHAVAAYTLSQETVVKDGQSMLIIDAGGATVDLCFFVVEDAQKGRVSMTEVAPVQGSECGSTFIDKSFEESIEKTLWAIKPQLEGSVENAAWEMRRSLEFQTNKKELGSGRWDDDDAFWVKVPGLKQSFTDDSLLVRNGEMQIPWAHLKRLFDEQIVQITWMIDQMIDRHRQHASTRFKQVDHVFLAGGLGSSAYVQQRIGDHIGKSDLDALKHAKLHESTEPQLSVCRGLVEHAIQSLGSSTMFPRRLSQSSLGIPCQKRIGTFAVTKKDLHKEARSKGRIRKDPSGHEWIEGFMDWFVKRGDIIHDRKTIQYKYSAEFQSDLDASRRVARIPIMTTIKDPIPKFDEREIVRLHTTLEADLSQVSDKSIVSKHAFLSMSRKKSAVQVYFLIEAEVGVAEVTFRCLDCQTKKTLSNDTSVKLSVDEQFAPAERDPIIRHEGSA